MLEMSKVPGKPGGLKTKINRLRENRWNEYNCRLNEKRITTTVNHKLANYILLLTEISIYNYPNP